MRAAYRVCALLLCITFPAYALSEGNSWDKVRYNGGTLQTKVDPKDWDNHLTITSDLITFKLKDGQQVEIPTKSVTALSYGQEAPRRVGTMVALGILDAPPALFGLFHKTRLHFIGIEYKTEEGKGAGLLLQGHKENYRAILTALERATDAPLLVAERDRESVPGLRNAALNRTGPTVPILSIGLTQVVSDKGESEQSFTVYVDVIGRSADFSKATCTRYRYTDVRTGQPAIMNIVTDGGADDERLQRFIRSVPIDGKAYTPKTVPN